MMASAFSSTRQAAAFAGLLLVLLLLPLLLRRLPSRREVYSGAPWRIGGFPAIYDEFYQQKGDVDIAFVGSSTIYYGIDTPYVEAALSKQLGRAAHVITVAWYWQGFDALYFITQDLLRARKVHTIVFTDVAEDTREQHHAAPYWFRLADNAEAFRGMRQRDIPPYYFAAILSIPRTLLSYLRPNSPQFVYSSDRVGPGTSVSPASHLGSFAREAGYDYSKFVRYRPVTPTAPSDVCVYTPATADKFHFSSQPLQPLQQHFAQKFGALAQRYGVQLILLTMPRVTGPDVDYIQERAFWPQLLHTDVTMMGIPPGKLFAGINLEDRKKLFINDLHLNINGQQYFTPLVTPSLFKCYENVAK
jgi:hypothetical protein